MSIVALGEGTETTLWAERGIPVSQGWTRGQVRVQAGDFISREDAYQVGLFGVSLAGNFRRLFLCCLIVQFILMLFSMLIGAFVSLPGVYHRKK